MISTLCIKKNMTYNDNMTMRRGAVCGGNEWATRPILPCIYMTNKGREDMSHVRQWLLECEGACCGIVCDREQIRHLDPFSTFVCRSLRNYFFFRSLLYKL